MNLFFLGHIYRISPVSCWETDTIQNARLKAWRLTHIAESRQSGLHCVRTAYPNNVAYVFMNSDPLFVFGVIRYRQSWCYLVLLMNMKSEKASDEPGDTTERLKCASILWLGWTKGKWLASESSQKRYFGERRAEVSLTLGESEWLDSPSKLFILDL